MLQTVLRSKLGQQATLEHSANRRGPKIRTAATTTNQKKQGGGAELDEQEEELQRQENNRK